MLCTMAKTRRMRVMYEVGKRREASPLVEQPLLCARSREDRCSWTLQSFGRLCAGSGCRACCTSMHTLNKSVSDVVWWQEDPTSVFCHPKQPPLWTIAVDKYSVIRHPSSTSVSPSYLSTSITTRHTVPYQIPATPDAFGSGSITSIPIHSIFHTVTRSKSWIGILDDS